MSLCQYQLIFYIEGHRPERTVLKILSCNKEVQKLLSVLTLQNSDLSALNQIEETLSSQPLVKRWV